MKHRFGDPRLPRRFWNKVTINNNTSCWEWTAARNKAGYGHVWDGATRKGVRAHRLAYQHLVGAVPDGLELDHLCRVRHCVNPAHLEPVTTAENSRRSPLSEAVFARGVSLQLSKTHCPKGHAYEGDNLIPLPKGGRACRECKRARFRDWYARNLERMRARNMTYHYANHEKRKAQMRAAQHKRKKAKPSASK